MIGIIPPIKEDLIPVGAKRQGAKKTKSNITIHNTANPRSTAQNERDWLTNKRNDRIASFQYAVDDKEAVLIVPEDEISYHAGSRIGNETSIAIEVCESGDQEKTYRHAVGLTAYLVNKYDWTIKEVTTHKHWSGKECPRLLLPKWDKFLSDVAETLEELVAPEWKFEGLENLSAVELLNDLEKWASKIDEAPPLWYVSLLDWRIYSELASKIEELERKVEELEKGSLPFSEPLEG